MSHEIKLVEPPILLMVQKKSGCCTSWGWVVYPINGRVKITWLTAGACRISEASTVSPSRTPNGLDLSLRCLLSSYNSDHEIQHQKWHRSGGFTWVPYRTWNCRQKGGTPSHTTSGDWVDELKSLRGTAKEKIPKKPKERKNLLIHVALSQGISWASVILVRQNLVPFFKAKTEVFGHWVWGRRSYLARVPHHPFVLQEIPYVYFP